MNKIVIKNMLINDSNREIENLWNTRTSYAFVGQKGALTGSDSCHLKADKISMVSKSFNIPYPYIGSGDTLVSPIPLASNTF